MALLPVLSKLEEVETMVNSILCSQIGSFKDSNNSFAIGPFSSVESNKINVLLKLIDSDIFHDVLSGYMEGFVQSRLNSKSFGKAISQLGYKLKLVVTNIQIATRIWGNIVSSRHNIYNLSITDGLNKEEILRYISLIQESRDNILEEISLAKTHLDEINSLIEKSTSNPTLNTIKCPITGQSCDKQISLDCRSVFIAYQFNSEIYNSSSFKTIIEEALKKLNLIAFFPDEHFEPYHISCEICQKLQETLFCIFEVSDSNPNVMFELGLAYMIGKISILLAKNGSRGTKISDIAGIHRIQYEDLVQCRDTLILFLKDSQAIHNCIAVSRKEVAATHE